MKKNTSIYIIIGLLIFTYVLLRAFFVDITYDEAWSIKDFSHLEVINILNYTPTDANNHIINTLLIKVFQYIFGESTFVSRLPNVIAFAVYLLFSYKIATKFLKPLIGIFLFIALFCNPFLLDFFGLARGYGLALSFMTVSIYYLINFLATYKFKFAYISLILASFAVLSNFPLINYWLALFFTIHVSYFSPKEKPNGFYKLLSINSVILVTLILIIYEPIRKLVQNNSLYYGGNSGFYSDTLHSLTAFSLYDPNDFETTTFTLNIILGFFILVVTTTLISKFRISNLLSHRKFLLTLLLIIPILSNVIQFYLLGNLYLIDRTALFYYPIIVIVIFFYVNDIGNEKLTAFSKIYTLTICIALMINQMKNLNLYKTITWDHDSRTTKVLSYLNNLGNSENKIINLDSSWPFQSSIRYYLERNIYNKVNYIKKERNLVDNNLHFFLYYDKSLLKVGYDCKNQPIHNYEKDTILQFRNEGVYLFGSVKNTDNRVDGPATKR